MKFRRPVIFELNSGTNARTSEAEAVPFHMHDSIVEIICVEKGRLKISDCALDHTLDPGDVYIFNAMDAHRIRPLSPGTVILTVHIDKRYYSRFFEDLRDIYFICGSESPEKDSRELDYLKHLMHALFKECSSETPSDLVTENLVREMLELLCEQFRYYFYRKEPAGSYMLFRRSSSTAAMRHNKRAYEIVDYIYDNFFYRLRLTDVAAKYYLSPSHMSRYIKKVIGISFSEILTLARCEEAERLLFDTEKTVDEIAVEVGFVNRKHMAVNFRKWYGKTPTNWRKSLEEEKIF